MPHARANTSLTPVAATRGGTETVARILATAEKLFAQEGFEAVSMHAVAEGAGVCKATIFHHFTSKRELYLATLRNACHVSAQHLQQLETSSHTLSERFAAFAIDMLHGMLEREQLHRLMQRAILAENGGELAKELAERVFGDKFARLVAILRAGQQRGELRSDFDPAMAAVVLIGANRFFLLGRNVFKHFPEVDFADDPRRYTSMLTDILLRGMQAPSPAPATQNQAHPGNK